MVRPTVTLYGFGVSHPVQAVRAMLAIKGIQYREETLIAGLHPIALRLKGFPGTTVPALDLDGEKVQGSRAISRRLESLVPEPPLFGSTPDERRAIEEVERWGEQELQAVHRRAFRLALLRRGELRTGMAAALGVRRPRLAAAASWPLAAELVLLAGAWEPRVRRELADLPARLDRVDALIADGTIGGERPNAADLQIGATIWALLAFDDFAPLVEGRPAARLARHISARRPRVRAFLPEGWLPRP
jgi:glutathione S-transferase